MKTNPKPKVYEVGLLRGMTDQDGKTRAKGEIITCNSNLAKIAASTGRGVILDSDEAKAAFAAAKTAVAKAK